MATLRGTMLPVYNSPRPQSRPGPLSHTPENGFEYQLQSSGQGIVTSNTVPKPLQITKHDPGDQWEQDNDDTPRARATKHRNSRDISPLSSRSSVGSLRSNSSMDSLSGPLGGQRPLTIPKRRDNNSSRTSQVRGTPTNRAGVNIYIEGQQARGAVDLLESFSRLSLGGTERESGIQPHSRVSQRSDPSAYPVKSPPPPNRPSPSLRSQPRLSNKASLMYLGRRYHGRGSESTSSYHSDMSNDMRPRPSRIPQNPSPSPSLRSVPCVTATTSGGQNYQQTIRSSPYLRTSKSMHHLSTIAQDICGLDGRASLPPPLSAVTSNPDTNILGFRDDGRHSSSGSRQDCFDDPYILVPRIVVTPESKTLEDGASMLWAAVQISTQVRPANTPVYHQKDGENVCGPSQLDVFRYGCLYDVSIEVLPTENSAIIDILNDRAYTNTLYPGSRLLVVVQVGLRSATPGPSLGTTSSSRRSTHVRQSSDDLIQDLEYHLGDSLTEYLQIRMKYRHSSFPHEKQDQSTNLDGVIDIQTSIETTARAAIKQHNLTSVWCPRTPIQHNPLFEIIASHWGQDNASDVMRRIVSSHSRAHQPAERRTTAQTTATSPTLIPLTLPPQDSRASRTLAVPREGSEDTVKPIVAPIPTRVPPPIPRRQASLQLPKKAPAAAVDKTEGHGHGHEMPSSNERTVWTQVRRVSLTEAGKPKTERKRSLVRSSVKRVPSTSPLIPVRPPSSPEFLFEVPAAVGQEQAGGMGNGITSASANRGLIQGTGETKQAIQTPRNDSKGVNGDYLMSGTTKRKLGQSNTEWAAGDGGNTKRPSNEAVDEERAKRRQKMLMEQASTFSHHARGSKRGSMGTVPRGAGGDNYGSTSRRYRQGISDMYRGEGEVGNSNNMMGEHHHRAGGGLAGSRVRKEREGGTGAGTGGAATGRWGWTGWWP